MSKRLKICLINPRSRPSYWTFDFVIPFYTLTQKPRYFMPNGALATLAALVPAGHEIVIVDENIEPLDFERLRGFDVIGVTGMVVQAERMVEILRQLRPLPATIVVGGPYVTVSEGMFEVLCDVRFIGEAEETWPAFLNALATGNPAQERYEQTEKTNMSLVPVPRFDLLQRGRYLMAPVQFSRGCPFLCEFCDIITIFGRRPRVKQPEQILAELDALTAQGFPHCFLVDDNFIGNKMEAKRLLRRIIEWQESRDYPLTFSTEASIDLSDDRELIDLMAKANFRHVFIGIETPREASLTETRKHQNVHGDSLLAKLDRIRRGGIAVCGGFIVGFDNDDERIFDEQFEFIQSSGIADLSVSLLTPIPTTPLYDRLLAEGRLDPADPELIFLPKQMTREQLKSGFRDLLNRVFDAEAYFERLFDGLRVSLAHRPALTMSAAKSCRQPLLMRLRSRAGDAVRALKLATQMAENGQLWRNVRTFPRVLRKNAALGPHAFGFAELLNLWIYYWHFASVTRHISGTQFGIVPTAPASSEAGKPVSAASG